MIIVLLLEEDLIGGCDEPAVVKKSSVLPDAVVLASESELAVDGELLPAGSSDVGEAAVGAAAVVAALHADEFLTTVLDDSANASMHSRYSVAAVRFPMTYSRASFSSQTVVTSPLRSLAMRYVNLKFLMESARPEVMDHAAWMLSGEDDVSDDITS